jgi:hypothetical protein
MYTTEGNYHGNCWWYTTSSVPYIPSNASLWRAYFMRH